MYVFCVHTGTNTVHTHTQTHTYSLLMKLLRAKDCNTILQKLPIGAVHMYANIVSQIEYWSLIKFSVGMNKMELSWVLDYQFHQEMQELVWLDRLIKGHRQQNMWVMKMAHDMVEVFITSVKEVMFLAQFVCACVFVCQQDSSKSYQQILKKFCGEVVLGQRDIVVDFEVSQVNSSKGTANL